MTKAIKKIVGDFVKQHSISTINYNTLKNAAKNTGYTIIEFNSVFNDNNVETIIRNLGLNEAVLRSRGFTYADSNYRLIFIDEDLNEEEKTLVLSHELGHIACGHFTTGPVIGKDVKEEYEANEFAHYLLKRRYLPKWQSFALKYKRAILVCASVFVVLAVSITVGMGLQKEQSYYGDYYVTPSGTKYHKKECIFVRDKTTASRLSKENFEAGAYEACAICLPE